MLEWPVLHTLHEILNRLMLAPYSKQRSVTVLLNLKRPLKRPSRETKKEEKRLYEEATSFFHPSPGTNFCFLSLPAAFHKAKKGGGLLFWCFAFSENASNNRLRPSPPSRFLTKESPVHKLRNKTPRMEYFD